MKKTDKKRIHNEKKSSKKNDRRIPAGIVAAAIVLAAVAVIIAIAVLQGREKEDKNDNSLGNGIYIEASEPYTGTFWEDGSDSEVEDVWSLKVVNSSDKDIQYLRIHAATGNAEGDFEITTLPAGGEIIVLESSAAAYPQDADNARYESVNLAFFQEELSILPDSLTLYGQDNWIKAENISGENIDKDIYVYYKNIKDGVLQGGITYRAVFPGGIPAGESAEQEVVHYMKDTSQVMYVTYEQE